jgi:hypothetical protein
MTFAIKTFALSCYFVFLIATSCFAFPLMGKATTAVIGSSDHRPHSFAGGEFTLTTDLDEQFASFCVEWEEHIRFGTVYLIDSVEDYANKGGGIDNGAVWIEGELRDTLSIETKWLMNAYVNGDLKSRYSSYDNRQLGGAMQIAIWDLEDEDYWPFYQTEFGPLAQRLTNDAHQNTQGLDYDLFSNVKVVNLDGAQSQIIAAPAPVPEPATMLMLGTGLIGFAGMMGRQKKKLGKK